MDRSWTRCQIRISERQRQGDGIVRLADLELVNLSGQLLDLGLGLGQFLFQWVQFCSSGGRDPLKVLETGTAGSVRGLAHLLLASCAGE
jgi:hypothetical protein